MTRERESATADAEALAAGFAAHIGEWSSRQNGDIELAATVRAVAERVSLATSAGDVCIALPEIAIALDPAPGLDRLRDDLRASCVVGTAAAPGVHPLVLDEGDRVYLHRYFDYERRLAERLVRAARAPVMAVGAAARRRLVELFPPRSPGSDVDWQQLAAALALRRHLLVVSGGPGTGKTTTVVNLLGCLIAEQPHCRIRIAAPTGKAGARLLDAINQRAQTLPPELRAGLPVESYTIHRLLRPRRDGGFRHGAANKLALDVLLVDEASMLDLALAVQLFEAVPDEARIVLLGDKDQLAAVESGAVFADLSADPTLSDDARRDLGALCGVAPASIVAPAPLALSALQDAVVWFRENYRFAPDSGIGRLAADIRAGAADRIVDWLAATGDPSIVWQQDGAAELTAELSEFVGARLAALFATVRRDPRDVEGITAQFAAFRILCATRTGPRGVDALNEFVTTRARAALGEMDEPGSRSPWYVGRPVLVTRNDYALGLMNGDVGIALPDANAGLRVYFPDGRSGYRPLPPARLPAHETAYAMTVHKAQGSEFDEVLLILPDRPSPILSRELVYTAVTRARHRVAIAACVEVLRAAITTPNGRRSGLLDRLRAAAAPGAGG
jgi:exodeoxyribonuclease V alpha subunit